jgi:hypothetical protein
VSKDCHWLAFLLYDRINRDETEDLESLLPSLMYFAVLLFEGRKAASAELSAAR